MDDAKVVIENKEEAKRSGGAAVQRPSLLGWVRKKWRRITHRKKKDLEIYPLF
jgi:hypothetical protein